MARLRECPRCRRHVRVAEAWCRFCALGLAVAACHTPAQSSPPDASAAPPPETASSSTSSGELALGGADGGLGLLGALGRDQRAVYGAPPGDNVHKAKGVVSVSPEVPAAVRGPFTAAARACYERLLQTDPTVTGKVVLNVVVRASGDVDNVTATPMPASMVDVGACVAAAARRIEWGASAAPRTLVVTLAFTSVKD
jgi:hypothetical protein